MKRPTAVLWALCALAFRQPVQVEAQVLPGLAPTENLPTVASSSYQIFRSGSFDLGQHQLTFTPRPQPGQGYNVAAEALRGVIELKEEWEVADNLTTASLGRPFFYAGKEHIELHLHQLGYITFSDSQPLDEVDCLDASSYASNNVIVALCSADSMSLVRFVELDDRLVVQWALPWEQCTVVANDSALAPAGTGGLSPSPTASYTTIAQAELWFDGGVRLAWTADTPCHAAVGLGIAGSQPRALWFSEISAIGSPLVPNCSTFSVEGLGQAFPCTTRKAVILPPALPQVVLFADRQLLQQQVVTVVNVAGQEASKTGSLPPAPAAPAPASPAGLSRASRGLKQLPAPFGGDGGGLALLQNIESRISSTLRSLAPIIAYEVLGLESSSFNATAAASLPAVAHTAVSPTVQGTPQISFPGASPPQTPATTAAVGSAPTASSPQLPVLPGQAAAAMSPPPAMAPSPTAVAASAPGPGEQLPDQANNSSAEAPSQNGTGVGSAPAPSPLPGISAPFGAPNAAGFKYITAPSQRLPVLPSAPASSMPEGAPSPGRGVSAVGSASAPAPFRQLPVLPSREASSAPGVAPRPGRVWIVPVPSPLPGSQMGSPAAAPPPEAGVGSGTAPPEGLPEAAPGNAPLPSARAPQAAPTAAVFGASQGPSVQLPVLPQAPVSRSAVSPTTAPQGSGASPEAGVVAVEGPVLLGGAPETSTRPGAAGGRSAADMSGMNVQPISSPTTIILDGPSVIIAGADESSRLAASVGRFLLEAAEAPLPATAPVLPVLPGGQTPAEAASTPALAPVSVEAVSGTVTAVGIKETPPVATTQQADFVPAPGCSQPRQAGPCDRYSIRWFFDAASGSCADFLFGGCMGNLNNFASLVSCQQACIQGTKAPSEGQPAGEVSVPGEDELVFLISALTAKSWITLDATSGVLPAGASAALHLTYNTTGLPPGSYRQNISINSNDPEASPSRLQASLEVFCGRLAGNHSRQPPNVTYVRLTAAAPEWAEGASLADDDSHVYFELDVIASSPVANLLVENVAVEAGQELGTIISVTELDEAAGYGPMCSAWRVRGAAPLAPDYAEDPEGTTLTATVAGLRTAFGEQLPQATANITMFNTLPQCELFAQGMVFGGDFGLAVDSNSSSARAVLVCTTPLEGLCAECILPQSAVSENALETTFLGLVPGKQSQYDIQVSWPRGDFFGAVNLTIACNATDDIGRPLAPVQPLPFAVVANPQLNPAPAQALPPAEPMYPPGLNPYVTSPTGSDDSAKSHREEYTGR